MPKHPRTPTSLYFHRCSSSKEPRPKSGRGSPSSKGDDVERRVVVAHATDQLGAAARAAHGVTDRKLKLAFFKPVPGLNPD
jgi:hypothetical protein